LAQALEKKPHRIPMLPIFRSAHLNAAMMAATVGMSMRWEVLLV